MEKEQFEVRHQLTNNLKGVEKKWAKVWVPGIQLFPPSSVDPEVRASDRLGTIWIMIISISHASLHPPSRSGWCYRNVVTANGSLSCLRQSEDAEKRDTATIVSSVWD